MKNKYPWGKKEWTERTKIIAKMIPKLSCVLDLGGGLENLKKYLDDCQYGSIDKAQWTPDTIVGDFNKGQFPDVPNVSNIECLDIFIVCQGVIEYIDDPLSFLQKIKKYGKTLIITYNFRSKKWRKNHFTPIEISGIIERSGWKIQERVLSGVEIIYKTNL